jgi:16S rRNA (guanine527-N7)-methyltransferase
MARSPMPTEDENPHVARLNKLLIEADSAALSAEETSHFETFFSLFVRWNSRINLSSVREPEAIISRHFLESIACARHLPVGISTLLDFGSGGGLPGIPIAICRPELSVTLAESQGKKAAFLMEAIRALRISATVFDKRAETLTARFDCVTLRAVDKMVEAVGSAAQLLDANGYLALMTTRRDAPMLQKAAGAWFEWAEAILLPGSTERILRLGRRIAAPTI